MERTFLNNLGKRRSIYTLGKNITDSAFVLETLQEAVRLSPSAFNAQTGRVLIVTGQAQEKLWGQIIPTELKAEMDRQGVPESAWEGTKAKLDGFKAAFGTALFFEETDVVKGLQESFPLYADNFPDWSEQDTGILSINAWTALAEIGIGANLQHYNPVIDEAVAKEWDLPAAWKLRGQLVFGSIEGEIPEGKERISDDVRFKIAD
jgi:predicted oxidoreductase (fatty acid repression mutant protein)